MSERLSDGDIAWIVGELLDRKKDPEGAKKLLRELDIRLASGEPVSDHMVDYVHWAVGRLDKEYSADDAFGLSRSEGAQPRNAERDELIAYLVQRAISSGKYDSQEAAALAVRDDHPHFNLSQISIRNIYRRLKNRDIVKAAAKDQ